MSLTSLENPLERLKILTTAMNWRGGWDITEQYYLHDVVVSPANSASYILTGPIAFSGGPDPSFNPDWTEVSNPTTGVASVTGSAFITIGGSPTNPQVINNGVCGISVGLGLQDLGTPNNPVLINTGITSLQDGLGISTFGNTITNTGIRTLTVGAGLSSSGGNDPSVSNTGIISLIPSTYIGISSGQTPTITNNGVVQVSGGTGISIGGTANIPIISTTITPPTLTRVFTSNQTQADSTTFPTPASGTGILFVFMGSGLFGQQLQFTGTPTANGIWLLDMSNHILSLSYTPPIGPTRTLQVSFWDTVTAGGPFSYQPLLSTNYFYGATSASPATTALGVFPFDITIARAAGLRQLTEIRIDNNTLGILEMVSWGSVFATYYPSGLQ
jgi:hypothetical protein